jgi:hypothetical protein
LQRYNPNSKFTEHETPFPTDFTFSKDNCPVTDHDKQISKNNTNAFPPALLCVHHLTLPTTPLQSGETLQKPTFAAAMHVDFCALIWVIGFLQPHPYNAAKFYPEMSLPIPSMTYAANTAYHIPTSPFLLIPAGKTAHTLASLPSDT